jgi:ABC-type sugar transport system ATPase subunit
MSEPLLRMEHITKRFPGVLALDDVSLEILPGETHGLLGENGAGKSTLLKILSGAYRPDAGSIMLGGKPLELKTPLDAQKHGIVTIYQEFNLIPTMTVAENMFLGREPGPWTRNGRVRLLVADARRDGEGAATPQSRP